MGDVKRYESDYDVDSVGRAFGVMRENAKGAWVCREEAAAAIEQLKSQLAQAREQVADMEKTNRHCVEMYNQARFEADRLKSESADAAKCKSNSGGDPPQECDFPLCGCNPIVDKAIDCLHEMGLLTDGNALDCGHSPHLLIKSVESDVQFCELCDAITGRRDAELMEQELRAENQQLRDRLAGAMEKHDDA